MVSRRFPVVLFVSFICIMLPAVAFADSGVDFGIATLRKGSTLAAGGSLVVTGNRSNGISMGTLFSGSFSGPVTWTLVTLSNGTNYYTLGGTLTGTLRANAVESIPIRLTINAGKSFFDGSTEVESADKTFVGSVPEPSTLSMLGTGAFGLLGVLRRKLQA